MLHLSVRIASYNEPPQRQLILLSRTSKDTYYCFFPACVTQCNNYNQSHFCHLGMLKCIAVLVGVQNTLFDFFLISQPVPPIVEFTSRSGPTIRAN